MSTTLPKDSAERKEIPLYEGLVKYFPAALAAVARVSKRGNDKHNPGQPLHHARGKSADHADCILRHLTDATEDFGAGIGRDENGEPQVAYIAWRALALCQEWLEKHEGAPLAPGAKVSEFSEAAQDIYKNMAEVIAQRKNLTAAEQVLAHEGFFEGELSGYAQAARPPIVKRGPHGEYGQERRAGPKDRRQFYNHEVANRNGRNRTDIGPHKAGRRSTDTLHWFFLPVDRRVGEADRRTRNVWRGVGSCNRKTRTGRRAHDKDFAENPWALLGLGHRRVGEADRRKVNNEFIARDKGYRRKTGWGDMGRRSTDKTPFWTLPKVGL